MFKISFDFDEITQKISNIKVISEKPKVVDLTNPTLLVLDNKLQLSESAINILNVTAGERIAVTYWQDNTNNTIFPVIGKSEIFTDKNDGNRVTQSNTVSFRGKQRETLLIYGNQFTLEEFKTGIFKLVPILEDNSETETIIEAEQELENIQDLEEEMIDETFDFDDLPF